MSTQAKEPLRIREATISDFPAVVGLLVTPEEGKTREEDPRGPLNPRYRAAFETIARDDNNGVFVAECGARIVGVFQLTIVQYLGYVGGRVAQIENVVVAPDERKAGIGTVMMRWAIDEARRRGCFRVQLTSHKGRARAHHFYEKLGFVRSHEGFRYPL